MAAIRTRLGRLFVNVGILHDALEFAGDLAEHGEVGEGINLLQVGVIATALRDRKSVV